MRSRSVSLDARSLFFVGLASCAVGANASALFFNSSATANNTTVRSDWLAACGIAAGQHLEDFERIPLDTNLHGISGVLLGGLVITDSSSVHRAFVRGSTGSYFGGGYPIFTRAVAHNEQPWLELDFNAVPVDYIGGFDIDHSGTKIVVTFTDDTTADFTLETTASGGHLEEFWGIYRNDMPRIKHVKFDASGDGEWGLDNLEFGCLNPLPISGSVQLQDFIGDSALVSATFEVRAIGSTTPLETHMVALGANGEYSFATGQPAGTYDIAAKPTHWLRKLSASVVVGASGAQNVDFSVVNGDVDGDNAVTVFDYVMLSDSFDTVPGDTLWNANADLDGDGAVTVFDYSVLSANFDLSGDD